MPSSNIVRNCTVKILDEVHCVFIGLHPDHLGYFYDAYARKAPNYFFSPKFKLGQWDGEIRFFWKTGKTYNRLLDELIPRVVGLGYKVRVEDDRVSTWVEPDPIDENYFNSDELSKIVDPETGKPIIMRPYQVDLINALLENGGGVGIAGTGAGKTYITAAIADAYGRKGDLNTLTIVPSLNLVFQTRDKYRELELDAGIYCKDEKDLDHQHVVSTWQSLQNNPSLMKKFQVVIVDECHGIRGNVLTNLLNEYGNHIAHRFGVTGTLPKEEADKMSIRCAVGAEQFAIPAHELIEQGWLAKLHIDVIEMTVNMMEEYEAHLADIKGSLDKPPTYRQFKDSYFPDFQAEKRFLITDQSRLEWICDYIEKKRDAQKGNVLCFIDRIAFGKKLTSMIEGAHFIHGKDPMKARREIYELFKHHEDLVVIANVKCAGTGLSIDRIFNLMFIDMGKSFIRVIQSIGRGLRKGHDKDSVQVTDLCSDLKYSRRHSRERIGFYKEAKYPYKKRKVDYS